MVARMIARMTVTMILTEVLVNPGLKKREALTLTCQYKKEPD
jgi:hypothetical protein